jgi:hypothetical protein
MGIRNWHAVDRDVKELVRIKLEDKAHKGLKVFKCEKNLKNVQLVTPLSRKYPAEFSAMKESR